MRLASVETREPINAPAGELDLHAISAMYRDIKYFANITPLRFIAAYLVVLYHIEETRKMFNLPNLTEYSVFQQGALAVTFFFVLSGFLITYLLLREHAATADVAVGKFYLRRMLRIWPLYFLMVFIGLVLIPLAVKFGRVKYQAPFESLDVAAYFLFFVPFIVNLEYGNHFLTPLWSVGIEEIYYLGWAPIVKFLRRNILAIMLGTVMMKAALAIWAYYVLQNPLVCDVLRMLQFEAMALGGLGAYFVFYRELPLERSWVFSKPVQVAVLALLAVRIFGHQWMAVTWPAYDGVFNQPVAGPLVAMTLFGWLIVNVAVNRGNILRLESRLFNYLGDISYGVYMYHALVISVVFVPKIKKFRAAPFVTGTIILHVAVIGLTLVLAALSKRYFENRFLRYKSRLQTVDDAVPAISTAANETAAKTPARAA